METFQIETTVAKDGTITIKSLPFREGTKVAVIVRGPEPERKSNHYPLRGKPIRYTDPFGSVAEDDWKALK